MQDGEPPTPESNTPIGLRSTWEAIVGANAVGVPFVALCGGFFLLVPLVAAWAIAAAPAHAGSTEISLPMDDGVSLAATLYLPDGTAPAGGWPAVMLFHGLGGTRASMAPIAQEFLVNQGYAVLAYDARGHGASGGLVSLDGPRELADLREAFTWFTSRSDVSDTQVGAMGFSLGGGAVLRAAVEGVPFKAIIPTITWTDLYGALAPQGWPKTGAIASFLQSVHTWDPTVFGLAQDAIRSQNTPAVKAFAAQRSSCPNRHCPDLLAAVNTPTFFIQGRRDYAFDIDQALLGYKAVKGPKRLYLGDLGHAPAANPEAEKQHYLTEAREWFDRYLKGIAERDRHAEAGRGRRRSLDGQDRELQGISEDKGPDPSAQGCEADDRRDRQGREDGQASRSDPSKPSGRPAVTVSASRPRPAGRTSSPSSPRSHRAAERP